MNQTVTRGIVLSRTNFGEADRILTVLTAEHGKLRLIAKGVRKSKSRLAGGIELFSVSELSFIRGRGDISTLTSARLETYYADIVKDLASTMLGYEVLKKINKVTEDAAESDYFSLLHESLEALNTADISNDLIQYWFLCQLLWLAGHAPNLQTDTAGNKLSADMKYEFSFDDMAFMVKEDGPYNASSIKILRLLFSENRVHTIARVQGLQDSITRLKPIIQTMTDQYLRT